MARQRLAWRTQANGGWGEIRTPETLSRPPVFKTGAINHSATHPMDDPQGIGRLLAFSRSARDCPEDQDIETGDMGLRLGNIMSREARIAPAVIKTHAIAIGMVSVSMPKTISNSVESSGAA